MRAKTIRRNCHKAGASSSAFRGSCYYLHACMQGWLVITLTRFLPMATCGRQKGERHNTNSSGSGLLPMSTIQPYCATEAYLPHFTGFYESVTHAGGSRIPAQNNLRKPARHFLSYYCLSCYGLVFRGCLLPLPVCIFSNEGAVVIICYVSNHAITAWVGTSGRA